MFHIFAFRNSECRRIQQTITVFQKQHTSVFHYMQIGGRFIMRQESAGRHILKLNFVFLSHVVVMALENMLVSGIFSLEVEGTVDKLGSWQINRKCKKRSKKII